MSGAFFVEFVTTHLRERREAFEVREAQGRLRGRGAWWHGRVNLVVADRVEVVENQVIQ